MADHESESEPLLVRDDGTGNSRSRLPGNTVNAHVINSGSTAIGTSNNNSRATSNAPGPGSASSSNNTRYYGAYRNQSGSGLQEGNNLDYYFDDDMLIDLGLEGISAAAAGNKNKNKHVYAHKSRKGIFTTPGNRKNIDVNNLSTGAPSGIRGEGGESEGEGEGGIPSSQNQSGSAKNVNTMPMEFGMGVNEGGETLSPGQSEGVSMRKNGGRVSIADGSRFRGNGSGSGKGKGRGKGNQPHSCTVCCTYFSAVAIIFLLFIGIYASVGWNYQHDGWTQAEKPDVQFNAFGGAGLYLVTMVISLYYWKRNKNRAEIDYLDRKSS